MDVDGTAPSAAAGRGGAAAAGAGSGRTAAAQLTAVALAPRLLPAQAASTSQPISSSGTLNPNSSSGGAGGAADDGLDEFILSNLHLPHVRQERVAALAAHARAFSYAMHERLMTLGTMFSKNVE